jgi:hypothetical protein
VSMPRDCVFKGAGKCEGGLRIILIRDVVLLICDGHYEELQRIAGK